MFSHSYFNLIILAQQTVTDNKYFILQQVASDLISFLENNNLYSPILIHGFSVGGYVWGECMVHMAKDTERYKVIIDRICGQIWDSAADITEIPIGVPKAMFHRNYTMQRALRQYMMYVYENTIFYQSIKLNKNHINIIFLF